MKKLYSILAFAWLVQCCVSPNENIEPEKLQLTFSPAVTGTDGGRTQSNLDDVHALRLSVKTSTNVSIFSMKEVELIRFGDALISEPVELAAGDYKVTDFLLINEEGDVIYATPQENSPLASAVGQALPFYFTVSKNNVANFEIDVIDVNHREPEAFGYASFNIKEVLAFQLSALTIQASAYHLTDATANIYDGETLVKTIPLAAKVNNVSFHGDASKTYTLKVSKDTYTTFSKDFIYGDLLAELDGLPLQASLYPTMTLTTSVFNYSMRLEGASSLTIDWGDGNIETGPGGQFDHTYLTDEFHNVVITGDLENVTGFYSYYGYGWLDLLNVDHLENLEYFAIGLGSGPEVVDLTHNTKVNHIDVTGLPEMKHLVLPADHRISWLAISGENQLTVAEIDALIDDIHGNAVLHNIMNGVFELHQDNRQPNGALLGPPSPAQVNKLKELRDGYGWSLNPNIP